MIALRAPLSVEYEGPCLWAALELAHGRNIYNPGSLTAAPWAVMIYTPLYCLMAAPFQFIGDYNYWGMRLISMAAYAATIVYSHRLLNLYTKDRLNTIIALLAFSSFIATWSWSWKARVDMLALAFSVLALYWFERAFRNRLSIKSDNGRIASGKGSEWQSAGHSLRIYALSIAFLTAAIYTKQSSLVILPAIFIYLLLKRRIIDCLVYTSACLIICGGLTAILQTITDGGFLLHMNFGSKMPFSMHDLGVHLAWLGPDWPKLWLVPILALLWLARRNGQSQVLLPVIVATISGAASAYTIGTMYANVNHALVFFLAACWLLAIFLEALPLAGGLLLILSVAVNVYIMSAIIPKNIFVAAKMDKTILQLRELNLKGRVIFVEDPALAIACGAKPLWVDVATFIQVWQRDKRSLLDIESELRQKKFPVVIINENDSLGDKPLYFWSESLLGSLKADYEKLAPVAGNGEVQELYIPKSPQSSEP